MTRVSSTAPCLDADRAWLEALRRRYHHRRFVKPDPVQVLYDYREVRDREIVALIASSLAYGNVKAMRPAIRRVLDILGPAPAETVHQQGDAWFSQRLRGFRYRFTTGRQIASLLAAVGAVLDAYGSLEACFARGLSPCNETTLPALGAFVDSLHNAAPRELGHLLPHPSGGSACKRLNLFLRWMVRRDAIDPGGWDCIEPRLLIMPLDTHVYQTARARRWTTRRTPDLKAALAVTAHLRSLCPEDPLRWDFAITRPGIRRDAPATSP
jgi:uncharacterized protein (TIGR02757 family)